MLRSGRDQKLFMCSKCRGLLSRVSNLHMCKDWEPIEVQPTAFKGGQGRSEQDIREDGASIAIGLSVLAVLLFWWGIYELLA